MLHSGSSVSVTGTTRWSARIARERRVRRQLHLRFAILAPDRRARRERALAMWQQQVVLTD